MKLKFKKEGWFCDATTARYKARLNDDVYVTVEGFDVKDYRRQWFIKFDSENLQIGIKLDDRLNRYIDPCPTKKYAIESIIDLIENNEDLKKILNETIR